MDDKDIRRRFRVLNRIAKTKMKARALANIYYPFESLRVMMWVFSIKRCTPEILDKWEKCLINKRDNKIRP